MEYVNNYKCEITILYIYNKNGEILDNNKLNTTDYLTWMNT